MCIIRLIAQISHDLDRLSKLKIYGNSKVEFYAETSWSEHLLTGGR